MPLTLAQEGTEQVVQRITGNSEIRNHLNHLGFTTGSAVTVVSSLGENMIVKVKESRIALDASMARRIMI